MEERKIERERERNIGRDAFDRDTQYRIHLFTTTLDIIVRQLHWDNNAVEIDGGYLNNVRFADEIFLRAESPREIQ